MSSLDTPQQHNQASVISELIASGRTFGRYVVTESLVPDRSWIAYDAQLGRKVAIELVPDQSDVEEIAARIQVLGRVSHPHVARVYDVGRDGEDSYVVYEYVSGQPLTEWVDNKPLGDVVTAFVAAGRGLIAARTTGLAGGTFSADNVIVSRDSRILLAGLPFAIGDTVGDAVDLAAFATALRTSVASCGARGERPSARLQRVFSALDRGAYTTLSALVDALEAAPRRRKMWIVAGAAVAGAGALALTFGMVGGERKDPQLCSAGAERLTSVWGPAQKQQVQQSFRATNQSYVESSLRATEQALETWGNAWTAAYVEACEATQVRGDQPPAVLDLRMACLSRELEGMRGLVGVLGDADKEVVRGAIKAAQSLPPVTECSATAVLAMSNETPADPALKQRVDAIRGELAQAIALGTAGRATAGVEMAKPLIARADELDWAPLRADARSMTGDLLVAAGAPKDAEPILREAVAIADAASADTARARALQGLTFVSGRLARIEETRALGAQATAAIKRMGGDPMLEAELWTAIGQNEATVRNLDKARELYERALASYEELEGPQSLDVAMMLYNLSIVMLHGRQYEKGREYITRSLAIREAVQSPDHPDLAKALSMLGDLQWHAGDIKTAIETHRKAVDIAEKALGPDHGDVAWLLHSLAGVLFEAQLPNEARPIAIRAATLVEKTLGPDHPELAMVLNTLAMIEVASDNARPARQYAERAYAIRLKALGPDSPRLRYDLGLLSDTAAMVGDYDEAIDALEKAMAIATKINSTGELGTMNRAYAVLLWDSRRDRKKAVVVMRKARDILVNVPAAAPHLAFAEEWLTAHDPEHRRQKRLAKATAKPAQ